MGEGGSVKRLILAWAATAVAATGAAVAALGLVSGALTGTSGQVLTQGEARAALATLTRSPPPSAAPTSPPQPGATTPPGATTSPGATTQPGTPEGATTEPGTPEGEFIRTPGGTVIASCSGGLVTLRSWSPAQGHSVDGVEPGPAREAEVEFEADEGEDVELRLGCSGDRPVRLGPS
jgi:serine/threonine-protein kinase